MCLLERRTFRRSKRVGWLDRKARFLRDLATRGIPMSLASLKASCDLADAETDAERPDAARDRSLLDRFQVMPPTSLVGGLI